MTTRAIGDRIILRKVPPATVSRGGVHIPAPNEWGQKNDREDLDAPRAVVVSVGPRCTLGVKPGDRVIWNPKGTDRDVAHDFFPTLEGLLTVCEETVLAVEEP